MKRKVFEALSLLFLTHVAGGAGYGLYIALKNHSYPFGVDPVLAIELHAIVACFSVPLALFFYYKRH